MEKKLTYEEIMVAWRTYFGQPSRRERFGQWFLNRYFPSVACPEIFYEEMPGLALYKIVSDPRFCEGIPEVEDES